MTPTPPRPSASDHPATWKFDYPIYHIETRPQWRSWLEHNHESTRGVWLCSWRTGTGRPRCPYPEVVEEAICFGWDRFDRHPPRRRPWSPADHPPQSQEPLVPTQPSTRRRHGKARPHDGRRTSCDRHGESERMVDHHRPSRRPPRTRRPHHSTRPKRAGTSKLEQLPLKRS